MVLSIYILKLQENKWYIGKTYKKVKERFQEHLDGKGSSWTSKYKPIKIHKIIDIHCVRTIILDCVRGRKAVAKVIRIAH
jgi:predicted GIY-YIG superfamily endonuclease